MDSNLPKRRVLIVDDHSIDRDELVALINRQPDLICCSQTDRSLSTSAAIALEKPDLVLLSFTLNNGDALAMANSLSLEFPSLQMLIFSPCDEVLYAERALQAGARGYIMKQEPAEEFLSAIRTILRGKIYLSHNMSVRLVQRVLKPGSHPLKQPPRRTKDS